MTIYLSRVDNGSGLGDAIVQTNWLFRLAQALGCGFVSRPLRSVRHLQGSGRDTYDDWLGLSFHRNPVLSADHRSIDLHPFSLEALRTLVAADAHDAPDTLVSISYPYALARGISDELGLIDLPAFPWLDGIDHVPCAGPAVDVVIHLRFGDSYAYPLPSRTGWVFDARRGGLLDWKTFRSGGAGPGSVPRRPGRA